MATSDGRQWGFSCQSAYVVHTAGRQCRFRAFLAAAEIFAACVVEHGLFAFGVELAITPIGVPAPGSRHCDNGARHGQHRDAGYFPHASRQPRGLAGPSPRRATEAEVATAARPGPATGDSAGACGRGSHGPGASSAFEWCAQWPAVMQGADAVQIEKGKQLYLEEARRRAGGFPFTHVPSHCKIPGNERADELAARGKANLTPLNT